MTEEAQVIQADRDAAAKLHLLRYGDPHQYGDILCGELDDDPSVQAFARHRIAAERTVREWDRAARIDPHKAAIFEIGNGLRNHVVRQTAEITALKADHEKLVRAVVERCAEVANEEKISAQQMRDAARKEKDGQGALVHAAEASAAFCIASAIRSLNIDDLVKEARK